MGSKDMRWTSCDLQGPGASMGQVPLPWDFQQKLRDFLKPGVRLLALGMGPEELLDLGHPLELVNAAAGQQAMQTPYWRTLCRAGGQVKTWDSGVLPFESGSFQLVVDREVELPYEEAARVLRPGGFLILQLAGGRHCGNRDGLPGGRPVPPDFNLENQGPLLRAAGFRVTYQNQAYPAAEGKTGDCLHYFMMIGKKQTKGEGHA